MRYLRKYNEGKLVDLEVLQDFCDLNLVYLLDEDFVINIEESNYASQWRECYSIWIEKEDPQNSFTWNSIKDYIIPFLELLGKRFEMPIELNDPITLDDINYNNEFIQDCRRNKYNTIYFLTDDSKFQKIGFTYQDVIDDNIDMTGRNITNIGVLIKKEVE